MNTLLVQKLAWKLHISKKKTKTMAKIAQKQFMNALVVCHQVEINIIDDWHCIGILKS